MSASETSASTPVPTRWVGPIRVSGNAAQGEQEVPLATFESPLWPSVGRGARVSRQVAGGIVTTVMDERMTRSVILVAPDAATAFEAARGLDARREDMAALVSAQSGHTRLIDVHDEIVGGLLFLRFAFTTGDASGHNMVTQAAEALMNAVVGWFPVLSYGSISGNLCADKKAGSVNGHLGRGRRVVAEIALPAELVARELRSTPSRLVALNTRKNLVGSTLAGAVRSANAHYANMLLAFYLATGQDAANIVEGSQGITYAEEEDDVLRFSCTLPHLIVGTVGNGKHGPVVAATLERLGCRTGDGGDARRLAALIAATVLCGELSLLAAQTNPGELMDAHRLLERGAGAPE